MSTVTTQTAMAAPRNGVDTPTLLATISAVTLEKVQIQTSGRLALRGFLGIDPAVAAGYDTIHCVVRIKGKGTPEQFQEIHETVARTSPNSVNVTRPVKIDTRLVVE